jgi:hypothetical protein
MFVWSKYSRGSENIWDSKTARVIAIKDPTTRIWCFDYVTMIEIGYNIRYYIGFGELIEKKEYTTESELNKALFIDAL